MKQTFREFLEKSDDIADEIKHEINRITDKEEPETDIEETNEED